ncbi:MAG TPA: MraY family glycosyltransferase [Anaerolineales bacterium]|nr:MraY family glycosyltransferase [Anaerolineales bacterium]
MAIPFLQLVDLFKASLAGLICALALSPLAIWIAKRVGLMDIPGSQAHKHHLKPTPLAGGIILVLSLVVLVPVFHLFNKDISPLLVALVVIFIFGLWDDAKGLGAPLKLTGQVIASIFLIASDVSVHFLEGLSIPHVSGNILVILDWMVTIFWFVGMTNAFNLIDSMDGLAVGTAGIAFMFFMIMAWVAQQPYLAIFSACLLGICIGLYAFNVSPAHLFLGDSGAQMLGFTLAAVGMIYTPHDLPQASSWFVPILVLGIPIFDTSMVVASRLIHHRPVFHADRTHTYHQLIALGLDPYRAVFVIHLATLVLCFVAFIALSLPPLEATLTFFGVLLMGLIILIFLARRNPKIEE